MCDDNCVFFFLFSFFSPFNSRLIIKLKSASDNHLTVVCSAITVGTSTSARLDRDNTFTIHHNIDIDSGTIKQSNKTNESTKKKQQHQMSRNVENEAENTNQSPYF